MDSIIFTLRNAGIFAVLLFLSACTVPIPTLPDDPLPTPTPAQATTPPTESYTGVDLAWAVPLGAEINWAPALLELDGQPLLIVSSEAGSVLALDPANGERVWEFSPPGRLWTDSVTVADDAVFLTAEGAQVFLLDGLTGAERWRASVQTAAGPEVAGLEARSKPTLSDGLLLIPTAGVGSRAKVTNPQLDAPLIALDLATGAEKWRFASGNYILRAPYADSETDRVYVGGNYLSDTDIDEGGAMQIQAVDLADGQLDWAFTSHDGLVKSVWAGEDVVVYAAYRDFLVGLDATSGAELYRHNTGNWVQSFTVFDSLGPVHPRSALAYGSANAFLNVIDPRDGSFVWRHNIDGTFNYPIGNAVLADDTVYFITQRGDLQALNASDGSLRWQHATGLETRDGIAVGAGHIFVGSVDGSVYAYRLR